MCDNTSSNGENTHDKSCQLKLNNINCHVIYHMGFGAQVSIPSIIVYQII